MWRSASVACRRDSMTLKRTMALEITEVQVEYGRTVNDGNYGAERVTIGLTARVEAGASGPLAEHLITLCRELVLEQLRQSPSPGVRSAIKHEDIASKRLAPADEVLGALA